MQRFVEGKSTRRAERRAILANIRYKARKIAQRRYKEQFQGLGPLRPQEVAEIYRNLMRNGGHYLYGGCHRVGCGLCHEPGLSFRDARQKDRFDREYREWNRQSTGAE